MFSTILIMKIITSLCHQYLRSLSAWTLNHAYIDKSNLIVDVSIHISSISPVEGPVINNKHAVRSFCRCSLLEFPNLINILFFSNKVIFLVDPLSELNEGKIVTLIARAGSPAFLDTLIRNFMKSCSKISPQSTDKRFKSSKPSWFWAFSTIVNW